jgi:hypothetical protein
MQVIWKYTLECESTQTISMPKYSTVLSLQVQNGVPCIWALVNPTSEKTDRIFKIYPTGIEFNNIDNLAFIGTFQIEGNLVFHVFEGV